MKVPGSGSCPQPCRVSPESHELERPRGSADDDSCRWRPSGFRSSCLRAKVSAERKQTPQVGGRGVTQQGRSGWCQGGGPKATLVPGPSFWRAHVMFLVVDSARFPSLLQPHEPFSPCLQVKPPEDEESGEEPIGAARAGRAHPAFPSQLCAG